MTSSAIEAAPANWRSLPLWAGLVVFGVMLVGGNRLLFDPDTYWQIAIGQWIVDHRAVPWTDTYSFTMRGQPWISTQWLAQVAFSQVYAWFGWTGPVVLSALTIALTYVLLAQFLLRHLAGMTVIALLPLSLLIAWPHFYARPHVLAMPVMVAWGAALLSAAERREAPSFLLVILMALWANLHGGFVFGLVLIGPIALDAVLKVEAPERPRLLLRWFLFGLAALAAGCITPYGWNSLLAARAILNLGEALKLIREWAPVNFGFFGPIEAGVLLIIALALLQGFKLPPMRAALFIGLLYMMLSHVRNAEVFALLGPMVVAAPLAAQYGGRGHAQGLPYPAPGASAIGGGVAAMLVMIVCAVTLGRYNPAANVTPAAAVATLKTYGAQRVFNDYDFGGYMISQGLPPYIDGRTELYGEAFVVEHEAAHKLLRPARFFELLEQHRIDATLMHRRTPAARILDQVDGWRKLFIDDQVVVHVRDADARHSVEPPVTMPDSN